MKIISVGINLSLIDKNKIKKFDRNGNPFKDGAQFYDVLILIKDEPDKYGNTVSIAEGQSKEQRESKEKKKYLGNGKVIWESQNQQPQEPNKETKYDDLPF